MRLGWFRLLRFGRARDQHWLRSYLLCPVCWVLDPRLFLLQCRDFRRQSKLVIFGGGADWLDSVKGRLHDWVRRRSHLSQYVLRDVKHVALPRLLQALAHHFRLLISVGWQLLVILLKLALDLHLGFLPDGLSLRFAGLQALFFFEHPSRKAILLAWLLVARRFALAVPIAN